MAQNPSSSDTTETTPEPGGHRLALRPLHRPGSAERTSLPDAARLGPQSSAETTTNPAGQTVPGVAPFPAWLRRLGYYGLALLLVATGMTVRAVLTRLVGPGLPTYLTFYPLVMLAALIGGWGPGVLATVAAVVVADYWLLPPSGFKIASSADAVSLAFFAIAGVFMSIVADLYRRIRGHLQELVLLRTTALRQANEQFQEQSARLQTQTAELRVQTEELAAANAALGESEERFHRLFQEDLTGDFLCTREGRITLCNAAFADIFGFSSADAAVGTSVLELYPDPGGRESILATLRAQGKLAYYETWRKRCDGTPIHVVENLVGHFNDQGELYEIQGYIFDDTDRKQAEEALRQQAQLLHLSYDAVIVWRKDGGIEHWNRGAEQLYGYTEKEVLGRVTHKLLKTIHAAPWPEIEAAMREHGQWEGELRHFAKDGHEVIVSARHQLVLGTDGIERILETNRDITDRKQAEEALRESERRWHDLAEALPQLVWTCTTDGRCDFLSQQWITYTGRSEVEQLDYGWLDQVHPDDRDHLKTVWDEAVARVTLFDIEFRIRRADGVYRWFKTRAVPVRNADGQVAKWFGSNTDIEDLKSTTEALRESEEKYRKIVETATEAIASVDAEARIVFVNDRWSEMFGYRREEALRMTHFDLLFPEDMVRQKERWESRQGGRKESYEVRLRRKDGSPVWALVGVTPNLGPKGEFLGTLNMLADITERRQAEEALRELNATLESRVAERTEELEHRAWQLQKLTLELTEAEERQRERMAQILHDDLQQVLAAAKFHVSRLKGRTRAPGQVQEIIGQVQEMLTDAIAKSRSLSHQLSPAVLRRGDLAETFDWLAEQMQAQHGLTVRVEAVGVVQARSDAVKTLMYRSAQEMLFNVVKHARVNEARLRIRRRGRYLCLSVSDRGRGFDPQEIRKTAGFGLWSIRERVALLGGRMRTRSAKGRGTTLRIIMPDAEPSPAARQGKPTEPEPTGRAAPGQPR